MDAGGQTCLETDVQDCKALQLNEDIVQSARFERDDFLRVPIYPGSLVNK